ncbi:MAG: TetR/AcrR family transcriptional regulator [Acidobacteriaceae bacterium]
MRTEDKLLAAAIRVLDQDGLDGATVPRIAQQAKLSPASIYRRFVDKDNLLRAAFLRVLGESNRNSEQRLQSLLLRHSLPETVTAILSTLMQQYRDHPRLLRALIRMLDIEQDSEFAVEAWRRLEANLSRMAEVLLAHRASIRHANPELAVRFAVLSATSAIELTALAEDSLWSVALPISDKEFLVELARQTVAYLVGPASH